METERRESDYEFTKNFVLRSVKDQVQRAGICAPSLPEPQPMSAEQEQLLERMAKLVIDVGDFLDRSTKFNAMVDAFVHVADRQSFQRLAAKVFVDDITWGKIITLMCVVGKTVAKILANSVPSIVYWTLDYFQNNLLNWICSMGGWINSISFLDRNFLEREFGSLSSLISRSSGALLIGAMLSGCLIWRLARGD